jgi:hypothetical protein
MITTRLTFHSSDLAVVATQIQAPDELPDASSDMLWFDQVFDVDGMKKQLRPVNGG